jgi:hypothetical protein
VIIGRPTREVGPFDRLELAARKFQWFFGRCGIGRQTYDCADETCDDAAHGGFCKRTIGLHGSNRVAEVDGFAGSTNVPVASISDVSHQIVRPVRRAVAVRA